MTKSTACDRGPRSRGSATPSDSFDFDCPELTGFPDSRFTGRTQVNAIISAHQPIISAPESQAIL
jgi:hypothetical protein